MLLGKLGQGRVSNRRSNRINCNQIWHKSKVLRSIQSTPYLRRITPLHAMQTLSLSVSLSLMYTFYLANWQFILALTDAKSYAPVWPDWAIFCFLGKHSKLVATIISPNLPTLFGNFCKGVKIIHFLVESFLATFIDICRFFTGHTGTHLLNISCTRHLF